MTKTCSLCKETLDISSFGKKGAGTQSRCKPCQRKLLKEHYQNNTQYYVEKARIRNLSQREKMKTAMLVRFASGCRDCGNADIRVLEFDHLNDKVADISKLFAVGGSLEKFESEMDKCDVVCANCHNIRTSTRANDWRTQAMS